MVSHGHILEDDILVPAAGQADGAEEQYEQFEHPTVKHDPARIDDPQHSLHEGCMLRMRLRRHCCVWNHSVGRSRSRFEELMLQKDVEVGGREED
jgi:hypothetical protein